ncbi:ABC transporter ATP-binding protein [Mesorhizobium sp. CGMCC 1.15528]|uniref:ABC transporter ATP-binding protein n=1 Tax=Mesorhizobium zhangyense TaxID=1776730 RepID=A0A7C9VHE2_9HYPH|nr:ABC transporter ATP-binding protein [Mesorhizobium zhangyense]NGN44528.1 ABC transporter ATP-binding protein [Mesorhizobium zhangyense]
MADAVLTAERVAKAFGAHKVLSDVRFRIGTDEIVGLLGPNGSGKSTLLNIVSGFSHSDAGEILFLGNSIAGMPSHKIARQGLVRTFQLPSMPHRMTVREVLCAGSRDGAGLLDAFSGKGGDDAEADELIEQFALAPVAHLPASSLSGGQKKLLSIAVALRTQPKLLCLDEPTAGVHPQLRGRMVELLKAFSKRGVAMLVVEHDMHFIRELCGRCIVLDRGEIIADCAPRELTKNERVVEAYLGKSVARQKVSA